MAHIYQGFYEPGGLIKKREKERELGRSLLMKGLEEKTGITYEAGNEPLIKKGPHGKPYLAEHPEFHYNISHTEGLVVCAVGDSELGVDVEKIRPYRDAILKKTLSEMEQRILDGKPEEEKQEWFFRFWTLKESYVKASGSGLTVPPSEISFVPGTDDNIWCSQPGYYFWQQKLGDDYILSLCMKEEEKVIFV
jgi:4'-phosphopantetheinyl transferase